MMTTTATRLQQQLAESQGHCADMRVSSQELAEKAAEADKVARSCEEATATLEDKIATVPAPLLCLPD